MPLPDDPDAFESAFRAAVAAVLPSTTVERIDRTIIAIKLRVESDEHRFIDVFFNARKQRVDLAVIEYGQRIFGYATVRPLDLESSGSFICRRRIVHCGRRRPAHVHGHDRSA